jgi:hypothetical protein
MDVEFWRFVNSFAPWLSAIGSLSAVAIALYLARQDKRVRLHVSVGHRLLVTQGVADSHPSYLSIKITNVGHRAAEVSNLTWKTGIFRKDHAIQTISRDDMSSPMPVRLKDGEVANYLVRLDDKHDWLGKFIEDFLPDKYWLRLRLVRFRVHTTIGRVFSTKLEKSFITLCLERITEKYLTKP